MKNEGTAGNSGPFVFSFFVIPQARISIRLPGMVEGTDCWMSSTMAAACSVIWSIALRATATLTAWEVCIWR